MFYINQIVRVLPDDHDIDFPDYGIVHHKDEGYTVDVTFKLQGHGDYRWFVKRSRVVESDRSDLQ